ncbi:hypothetical protein D3C81_1915580 [compost metagenome]
MRATEIIEGTLRQRPEQAAAIQHEIGNRIDRAITTDRDNYGILLLRGIDSLLHGGLDLFHVFNHKYAINPPRFPHGGFYRLARVVRVMATGTTVHDKEQRCL